MTSFRHPMESVHVYRIWQAPFAERKLRPFLEVIRARTVSRVLDVGCGPGTNATHFLGVDYLGVDINPEYIAHAIRRYGDRFRVEDVTKMELAPGGGFDCILVNSLLHHLPDHEVHRLLNHLQHLLTPDGSIHVLDLVLPAGFSIPHLLARADRGEYPRPLPAWRSIFEQHFTTRRFDPYPLGVLGLPLWQMIYFEGRRGDEGARTNPHFNVRWQEPE